MLLFFTLLSRLCKINGIFELELWYVTIRYDTLRSITIRYNTLRYVTIRYETLRYVTIRYHTLPYVTIRDAMKSAMIQYNNHHVYIENTSYFGSNLKQKHFPSNILLISSCPDLSSFSDLQLWGTYQSKIFAWNFLSENILLWTKR